MSKETCVLIVEDKDQEFDLIFSCLSETNQNFSLIRATNLKQAIQRIQTESFDIILADLNLEDSLGIQTFEIIQRNSRNIPIAIIIDQTDIEIAKDCIKNGAQTYFTKEQINAETLSRELQWAIKMDQQEQKIKVLNREIRLASRMKAIFLANMSHEIRTPINAILGTVDLLKENTNTDSNQDLISTLESAGESLVSIIDDVLDLTKIESGEIKIEHIQYDLSKLLSEIEEETKKQAAAKNISLTMKKPKEETPVLGDPKRIKQVITNLINNAIKFTNKGSVELLCNESKPGEYVIEVSDTGVGIPQESINRIFESFQKADSSITRSFGGTGLGLAITKQLVELMGGSIKVHSKVNFGSKFSVTIPLPRGHSSQAPKKLETKTLIDEKSLEANILIAEDLEINQNLLKAYLRKTNCNIESAFDGQKAVQLASTKKYDVIFMDCQMPIMDGLSATLAIRENEKKYNTPPTTIVALTANALQKERDEMMSSGCNLYLTKPVRKKIFLEAIHQVIETKQ